MRYSIYMRLLLAPSRGKKNCKLPGFATVQHDFKRPLLAPSLSTVGAIWRQEI